MKTKLYLAIRAKALRRINASPLAASVRSSRLFQDVRLCTNKVHELSGEDEKEKKNNAH